MLNALIFLSKLNSTKSVIYLLSSEKHIIFALQKRSNSTTIFVARHLRL